MNWEKLGLIIAPNPDLYWMATYAGPTFALVQESSSIVDLYVSGRDTQNRSRIGRVQFDIEKKAVISITSEPVLSLGERGTFDENGTSYPYLLKNGDELSMYFTGWIPGILVPFMNDPGLANSKDGLLFNRISKAPIMPKTDTEYLGIGSMCVIQDEGKYKMWYTCFDHWGEGEGDHKHYYHIKYAESTDGINWVRNNVVCITFKDGTEYAIAKPCVLKIKGIYHMWFSYRGPHYLIGYATSTDGKTWTRKDDQVGIAPSASGWDQEMICYGHVIPIKDHLYMFYNGNGFGKSGLGWAKLPISSLSY